MERPNRPGGAGDPDAVGVPGMVASLKQGPGGGDEAPRSSSTMPLGNCLAATYGYRPGPQGSGLMLITTVEDIV